jgi:hypothetical protein
MVVIFGMTVHEEISLNVFSKNEPVVADEY